MAPSCGWLVSPAVSPDAVGRWAAPGNCSIGSIRVLVRLGRWLGRLRGVLICFANCSSCRVRGMGCSIPCLACRLGEPFGSNRCLSCFLERHGLRGQVSGLIGYRADLFFPAVPLAPVGSWLVLVGSWLALSGGLPALSACWISGGSREESRVRRSADGGARDRAVDVEGSGAGSGGAAVIEWTAARVTGGAFVGGRCAIGGSNQLASIRSGTAPAITWFNTALGF